MDSSSVRPTSDKGDAGGRGRPATRRSVYVADTTARAVIMVGGFAVLAAALGICVYLFAAALPLVRGATTDRVWSGLSARDAGAEEKIGVSHAVGDEYARAVLLLPSPGVGGELVVRGVMASAGRLSADGGGASVSPEFFRMGIAPEGDEGEIAPRVTSISDVDFVGNVGVGLSDGRVRVGTIGFTTTVLTLEQAPIEANGLAIGEAAPARITRENDDGETVSVSGVVERSGEAQVRFIEPVVELSPPTLPEGASDREVIRVDVRSLPTGEKFVLALAADGMATLSTARTVRPLGGGTPKTTLSSESFRVFVPDSARNVAPDWLFVTTDGVNVLSVWKDGTCERFTKRKDESGEGYKIESVERVPLFADDGRRSVTAAIMLLGGQSLVVGDSTGEVQAFTPVPSDGGLHLVRTATFDVGSEVRTLSTSRRVRAVVAGTGDGRVVIHHVTSDKRLAELKIPRATPGGESPGVLAAILTPKSDAIWAMDSSFDSALWRTDLRHPEVSLGTLFGKVQYEGLAKPEWVYQSSAAGDEVEPKYSMVPLIYGTLKATLVAMLIAIPLAVLCAVYTSEFMRPSTRRVVKPTLEMMASLPSVVLGFIAAMVVSPWVAEHLVRVLVALMAVPVFVVLGGHVWQLIPMSSAGRFGPTRKMMATAMVMLLGVALAWGLGPALERGLFDGDMRLWLDGQRGTAWPGWWVLLSLPMIGAVWYGMHRREIRRRRSGQAGATPATAPRELARFLAIVGAGLASAFVVAYAMQAIGLDPRDSLLGTFTQRNTLVVGVIMGFAVVPIIYTISEDALRSVPLQLRTASLGAGATPWQTAVRVILPAAGSGVFSACMIGLGRAVGETMIVLMATGNTPEMSMNIFSGLRTLAANIAVELPEAPPGSTHYRVLVACGLVLFAMTFIINTSAEVVRQRVRKRLAAL